ncbi:hypothetical protein F5877DRAFT_93697 [Lentinula edodes]|nr:hypothetical protein F5877DRAFT_93697 [Lentinula edodes]
MQQDNHDFFDTLPADFVPSIDDIKLVNKFIDALKNATLENDIEPLENDILEQLRSPLQEEVTITNPDHRLSIDIFLSITTAAEQTYTSVQEAILRRHPESDILSFYKLSGVSPIYRDMCANSCLGFTRPFTKLEVCPYCGEKRYEDVNVNDSSRRNRKDGKPRKQFCTIPIGPQLQALWRSPRGAQSMSYRRKCTERVLRELQENEDFFDGRDVGENDIFLLYCYKTSNCWIYIQIILDRSPDVRYKKHAVLPGGFIPDSFVFPGLEGEIFVAYPHLALVTADGPAMAMLSGFVGHQGRVHCRFYCPLIGRHKPGASQYYPVRLKPDNYSVSGCDHGDSFTSLEASTRYQANLAQKNRLATGIKQYTTGIPGLFAGDIMHLFTLNAPDLFIPLWRGKFECDKTDDLLSGDLWIEHGKCVAACTSYIPRSFDRPPRNPAEKINSGYKAWEFLLYFYGLGPCLFFGLLPDKYWENYCVYVHAVQILLQESCLPSEVLEAHKLLLKFSDDFEAFYVQCKTNRLHFIRPSIHSPSHIPFETIRAGPGAIYSQWTMERTIGNLGEEIKQHSNPYANISQRGVRRCQVNALIAIIPDLVPDSDAPPQGSRQLESGYMMLTATDTAARMVTDIEARALRMFCFELGDPKPNTWVPKVVRWARVKLPNGQIARSRWKEDTIALSDIRTSRNVKIVLDNKEYIVEVHFYILLKIGETVHPVAIGSFYGPPHEELLRRSHNTYYTVQHKRDEDVRAFPITSIDSTVMMAPDPQYISLFKDREPDGTHLNRWFKMQKPGLKVSAS